MQAIFLARRCKLLGAQEVTSEPKNILVEDRMGRGEHEERLG